MKKIIPYLIGFVIALQAITPPLEFSINFTNSPIHFVWTFLFFGVLSFYFIFTKANIFLKLLLPYLFLNTFFSSIVQLSMATFIWIVIGAYFYLLCLYNDDWKPIFRILSCVLVLEAFLFTLRAIGHETLLNFGKAPVMCIGSVGNPMQFKALMILLFALIIQDIQTFRKYINWLYVPAGLVCVWAMTKPLFWDHFIYARVSVWIETLKLWLKHPFTGWGLGTFEKIFPAIARGKFQYEGVWENAHNDPIEVLFCIGIFGGILLLGYGIYLMKKCRGVDLIGSLLVLFTLCLYFPMNQPQTFLIVTAFAAYRERKLW